MLDKLISAIETVVAIAAVITFLVVSVIGLAYALGTLVG